MYGELINLVPKQFKNVSPTTTHTFSILNPSCHCLERNLGWRAARHAGYVATCRLRNGNHTIPIIISLNKASVLGNAIQALSCLPRNGYRPAKYLDLYIIFEGLGGIPRPDHRSLRNALAHDSRILTRSSTIERLDVLFGSKHVDFGNTQHERIFWRLFGELLVDVDVYLGKQLQAHLADFTIADK